MLGVLNDVCLWEKKTTQGKYPGQSHAKPVEVPCIKGIDTRLTKTDVGLVKTDIQYYILHTDCVCDGDKVDGKTVIVQQIKDIVGTVQAFKAVVCI